MKSLAGTIRGIYSVVAALGIILNTPHLDNLYDVINSIFNMIVEDYKYLSEG